MSAVMIDMDGVMADFSVAFSRLANKRFGHPLQSSDDKTTWDYPFPQADLEALWSEIRDSHGFWLELPSLVTRDEVAKLNGVSRDRDIYFVTNRIGYSAKYQTEAWLAAEGVEAPTVLVVRNGHKGKIAMAVMAEYAIDDKPSNIEDLRRAIPGGGVAVRAWKYNDHVDGPRVKSLGEFLELIDKESSK